MRLARVASPHGVAFARLEGEGPDAVAHEIADHPFGDPTYTGRRWPLTDLRLLAPILSSKVVCIGKNYLAHAREMGSEPPEDPVIFLKPSTSVIGPGASIVLPRDGGTVHHEGELAIVIGRPCKNVPRDEAFSVVLGYTIGNDVSARDQQRHDGQWTRAKGHDTFCPIGPWIETELDPEDLELVTEVKSAAGGDWHVRQHSRTSLLIHSIPKIIAWCSRAMTLLPGDVILTGTPEGVGPIVAGDEVSITIEGIGTLTNPVHAEDEPNV